MKTLKRPRYTENETFRRSVNRKMWFFLAASFVGNVGCICLAIIALAKPTPVVAFDCQGRPQLFQDTVSPRLKLEQVRVEYFTKEFLELYVGVDSSNADRDLRKAFGMMTPRLREIALHDKDMMRRRAQWEEANVRTTMHGVELKIAPFDPEDLGAKVHLIAWGAVQYEPRVGSVESKELVAEHFFSQIVLHRVPISDKSVHGVWVDYVNTKFFKSAEDLRIYTLKRKP